MHEENKNWKITVSATEVTNDLKFFVIYSGELACKILAD